mgnify:CR=1 FL=1
MTLSECYEEMGADLHEVLRRLKTEERIGKFLKLILKDTNYESLCKALEEKNDGRFAYTGEEEPTWSK